MVCFLLYRECSHCMIKPKHVLMISQRSWQMSTSCHETQIWCFLLRKTAPMEYFLHIFIKISVSARQPEKSEAYCLWSSVSLPWISRWKPRELLVRTRACQDSAQCLLGKKQNKTKQNNFSLFSSVGIQKTKCHARLQIWRCAWDPWVIFAEMCWKMTQGISKVQARKGSFWIYQDIYFFRGPKPFIRCAIYGHLGHLFLGSVTSSFIIHPERVWRIVGSGSACFRIFLR